VGNERLDDAIAGAVPFPIRVETSGTPSLDGMKLGKFVRKHFDLTPRGMEEALSLRRPIYRGTSYHGHFGRENIGLPWELTDKAEAIRKDL